MQGTSNHNDLKCSINPCNQTILVKEPLNGSVRNAIRDFGSLEEEERKIPYEKLSLELIQIVKVATQKVRRIKLK